MLATADTPPAQVKGVILSAPAVWGRSEMGLLQRAALWLAYQVAPGWQLTGEGLHIQASDNIPMLRKLAADPLVIKATRVDTIHGLVDLMDAAAAAAPRVRLPALVLYGEKDEVVPAEPTWAMIQSLPDTAGHQRVALYRNGYHMLLRDLQANVVLDDIATWIANPASPLPSGADAHAKDALSRRHEG
jgi:alpha-beta hydrolase superfamily lysophospholipase